MTSELVRLERQDALLTVTLNSPDNGNALSTRMVEGLVECFEGLAYDESIRVVILRAEGRHFCSGLDLKDPAMSPPERTPAALWAIQRSIARIYPAMRRCPQPIIAALQGAACGGGFSLALAADLRVASKDLRMNAAYLNIGLTGCDMGSSYFLPRLVNASVASQLLLTGEFLKADRAYELGLVAKVLERDTLDEAAQDYAQTMLRAAPMGLRLTKESLNYALDTSGLEAAMAMENRHQSLLALSNDAREAIHAFREKRLPHFTGK
ncbi:MAG: enoyl-CoA hydratase-related protein [Congregibacter sp.]|nr:enoyl-CoA hydratase-related protein [Congregibacter sp.]MDP5070145.1 enoyl-CoA hydratase-related protein [Congregibacter sp.]